jgi:hypothetical protein
MYVRWFSHSRFCDVGTAAMVARLQTQPRPELNIAHCLQSRMIMAKCQQLKRLTSIC